MSVSATRPEAVTRRDDDILARTISGLEAGLRVHEIAVYDPMTCAPDDDASTVVSAAEQHGFDQVPVVVGGHVIAVLERDRVDGPGTVREYMRVIDGSLVISSGEPITRLIQIVVGDPTPYRLVVCGSGIAGIVTQSDLLKLPVRLLAYTILTHLETVITASIRSYFGDSEDWLGLLLNPSLEKAVRSRRTKFAQARFDPALIELTYLREKVVVVGRMLDLDEAAMQELNAIIDLRNDLAHDRPFAREPNDLVVFRDTLDSAMKWIERLDNQSTD